MTLFPGIRRDRCAGVMVGGARRAFVAVLLLVMASGAVSALAADRRDHLSESQGVERPQATQDDSSRFSIRVTDNNQVHMTISNYGFAGNNFVSRSPSLEYPFGTGFEHMVRGGLWIGAEAIDDEGPFVGVVTGALDGLQGGPAQGATEFSPVGIAISARSTLTNSPHFNKQAISELDFIGAYDDHIVRRASSNVENHRPMGLHVRQENYSWSFSSFQHFVVFKFLITNNGPPLRNVWVGFYAEFASGPKNEYSGWPPSSTGSPQGSWYSKKLIEYDEDIRMMREHYCAAAVAGPACNFELVPHWIGAKLLGWKTSAADVAEKQITFGIWNWSPGDTARDTDVERYAVMSTGEIQLIDATMGPIVGDPAELLAVGPFSQIDPGDSISVDFAIAGGATRDAIRDHTEFAQRAFERDYVVPVPPPSPRFKVVARDETLDLFWDRSPEDAEDPTSPVMKDFEGYRVYVGTDRLEMSRVAQYDKVAAPNDTTGFNTGLDVVRLEPPAVFDGVSYHYKYTVPSLRNGFKYFAAVTAYDLGTVEIESLESGRTQNLTTSIPGPGSGEQIRGRRVSVFPNPYRVEAAWDQGRLVRDHYLWFANLPERCEIKIFTLAGDIVFVTDFVGSSYDGSNARGVFDPAREAPPTLSGRTFAWNLITKEGQAAATGLYLYSVRDKASGERTLGKFLIVKSDREEF